MIVQPDFFEHWKTKMLSNLLNGDPVAPLYVLKLWCHCQNRKAWVFADLPVDGVKAICGFSGDASVLNTALCTSGYLSRDGNAVTVSNWDEYNKQLIACWDNGTKGGRPKKPNGSGSKTERKPNGSPTLTQREPNENPTRTHPILSDLITPSSEAKKEDEDTSAQQKRKSLEVKTLQDARALGVGIPDQLTCHSTFEPTFDKWLASRSNKHLPMNTNTVEASIAKCAKWLIQHGIDFVIDTLNDATEGEWKNLVAKEPRNGKPREDDPRGNYAALEEAKRMMGIGGNHAR